MKLTKKEIIALICSLFGFIIILSYVINNLLTK